jgi:hypothetical protein
MAEFEEQIRRKPVRSLELICQIEVIQILHRKAADLESGYMTKWCLDELTNSNRQTERNLDLRSDIGHIIFYLISYHLPKYLYHIVKKLYHIIYHFPIIL